MSKEYDEHKATIQCLRKYPFLVTEEKCKELKQAEEEKERSKFESLSDNKVNKEEEIPVGVRMNQPQQDYSQFKPRCTQVTCCSRNLISTYPRDLPTTKTIPKVFGKVPPPSSTYRETIGRTGIEIFKAMKLYNLERSRKHSK